MAAGSANWNSRVSIFLSTYFDDFAAPIHWLLVGFDNPTRRELVLWLRSGEVLLIVVRFRSRVDRLAGYEMSPPVPARNGTNFGPEFLAAWHLGAHVRISPRPRPVLEDQDSTTKPKQ